MKKYYGVRISMKLCILFPCIVILSGCFIFNIFKPTPDEELTVEKWEVCLPVTYHTNTQELVYTISNYEELDQYGYYTNYDLSEQLDLSCLVTVDGHTLIFNHITGQSFYYEINPHLDPILDSDNEVIFDIQTVFYKYWEEGWGGISPNAKCQIVTQKAFIEFFD